MRSVDRSPHRLRRAVIVLVATVVAAVATFGGVLRLPRGRARDNLAQAASENRFVALTGRSGCGKTALAKNWLSTLRSTAQVVWLRAQDLESGSVRISETGIDLDHPIVDVLRGYAGTYGYVAVDGLDRAFEEPSFKAMATLVQLVRTGG
jgi:ABC-type cobalamin/Fe3+-siderophores transport system ATPase subunit